MNWRRFFRRNHADAEQKEELESYLDLAASDNLERGMDPVAARAAAHRKLGNVTQVREEVYRMNTLERLEDLLRHIRFTLRTLRRNPAFAAITILTLGIGIGANTTVFSVLDGVLLKPLAYPEADRLVSLSHAAPGSGLANIGNALPLSASMFFTYSDQNTSFEHVGVWTSFNAAIGGDGEPEQASGIAVSQGTLEALNVPPVLGRWFSEADLSPGSNQTVLLSHDFWQRRFGGSPSALGGTLLVDAIPRQIIGVMPAGFRIADMPFATILPLQIDRKRTILAGFGLNSIGRLKPGITLERANADIARLIPIWMSSWPSIAGGNNGDTRAIAVYESWRITPRVAFLRDAVVGNIGDVLWVVMGTLGLVMLIVCANATNLLLVHVEGRRQELSVRAALGAGQGRITRELLLESAVLALGGAILGVGLAYGGLRLLQWINPANVPRLSEISLDTRALLFTLAVTAAASLFLGFIPAWKYAAARGSLAAGNRTVSTSRERHRTRNVLVVAQVALALVLLVCSGLMIRTFENLRQVDPGFIGADRVQTLRLAIPRAMIPEPERVARTEQEIRDKLAAIPGVESVGFADAAPMDGSQLGWDGIFAEGQAAREGTYPPMRVFRETSPGFFASTGTRFLAGRDYTWEGLYNRRLEAIVSENLARELWGSAENAVGKRIRANPRAGWREVIGVVADVHINGVHQPAPAIVYWPSFGEVLWAPTDVMVTRNPVFAIRSPRANTQAFIEEIRQAVWSVNPNLAIADVETLAQIVNRSMARTSFTLVMLAIAGGMALVLGVIGIYGVISYAVSQRRREAGIRIALGAEPSSVTRMFVRHGIAMSFAGIAVGLAVSAGLARGMASLLFGVQPLDAITYAIAPLVLLLAALAACYIPARRAAKVDPAEALRSE